MAIHAKHMAISIHAPQWGATVGHIVLDSLDIFQSTHPSGVRRAQAFERVLDDAISIHAPQWGATSNEEIIKHIACISIHAPQWGATYV